MSRIPLRPTAQYVRLYLRGYAAILFCSHEFAGFLILCVTFIRPEVGLGGLLAAIAARTVARHLGYAEAEVLSSIYNALLVGLVLGSSWALSPVVVALAVAAGVVAALATRVLNGWLFRLNRLPAMSIAFVTVAWLFILVARDVSGVAPAQYALHPYFTPLWLNAFFTSLGSFLCTPHPLAGLAMFCALLFSSRYLALLAVAGYAVGALTLTLLGSASIAGFTGFNFMLAAMAVGGFYAFPDRASFAWGLFSAFLAALLCMALPTFLGRLGLPQLALPSLLATWLVIAGLAFRSRSNAPFMLLDHPSLPEQSLLSARLARARLAEPGSYPVNVPFCGKWQVSQGNDGPHTHRGLWRDAFDFIVVDERGRSFRNDGRRLEDYHGFGMPVLAPVAGQVWRCEGGLPDNAPGEFDTRAGRNFGNYVLVRAADGVFVLLGHLKQGSISVRQGEWIEAGVPIAACGNSGRSAQPHLHLQAQSLENLGAPTRPLHLRSTVVERAGGGSPEFRLSMRPEVGDTVSGAVRHRSFADALHLTAGRTLGFRDDRDTPVSLRVELSLLGQFRLVSDEGGSAAFDERPDVLAFYDRKGAPSPLLDAWVLALGLTPLSGAAERWTDAPPVSLAPQTLLQRVQVAVLRPFGANLDSHYERQWDATVDAWRQKGRHNLTLAPGLRLFIGTEALIDTMYGCRELTVWNGLNQRRFRLAEVGTAGDVGIPPQLIAVTSGLPALESQSTSATTVVTNH